MNQHPATTLPCAFDPITNGSQLRLECIDPVVAYALDVENLDPPRSFFDEEGALVTWTRASDEVWAWRLGLGSGWRGGW
jgi:hypothetical protein